MEINDGEFDAREVRNAKQLEKVYLNTIQASERVSYAVTKFNMRRNSFKFHMDNHFEKKRCSSNQIDEERVSLENQKDSFAKFSVISSATMANMMISKMTRTQRET